MKRLFAVLLIVSILLAPWTTAEAKGAKPAPPQSHGFGKTLPEWQLLYFTWFLGFSPEDHVGNVRFLPLPQGEPINEGANIIFVGNLDVALAPGTAFVLPVLSYVGERYAGDAPDDAALPDQCFTGGPIRVTLDGAPLLESRNTNLAEFYIGQNYFSAPLVYPEPQPRGEANAIAAIWVQSIGFVYPPLPVGEHTLELDELFGCDLFDGGTVGYRNTWHITVQP